jgi:antitoxin component of MazEF toxin-antitoxin module
MGFELTTTEKIQKLGNSYYVNIRKDLLEKLELKQNDLVELKIRKISITPK